MSKPADGPEAHRNPEEDRVDAPMRDEPAITALIDKDTQGESDKSNTWAGRTRLSKKRKAIANDLRNRTHC